MRRTRRPNTNTGINTSGISSKMMPASQALVTAIMIKPPSSVTALRNVIDKLTPAMDCTRLVSVVKRDSTSPLRVTSKNVGLSVMTWR